MAYRYGTRYQMGLFPQSIEEYVASNDPVRAYDAFVEALDFSDLGIQIDPNQVGNSEYDPKAMLKLFVYGYSYGIKSSRKLERETHHNFSFIWLMGGLKPDHKTIAEFRRKNKEALKKVLRQCARMCLKLDLIAGNVLFVDGTKIRANAARGKTHDQAYYEQRLSEIDGRIEQLVEECEKIDQIEEGSEIMGSNGPGIGPEETLEREDPRGSEDIERDRTDTNQSDRSGLCDDAQHSGQSCEL